MEITTYSPQPLDTSDVLLPDSLVTLLERLAENTHDVWAAQRIKEGWAYGPKRDDASKKHPCLVPYADLPESEKEYDRKIAGETLRAVMALGYSVSKP
jgi:ryanodine receptor 2